MTEVKDEAVVVEPPVDEEVQESRLEPGRRLREAREAKGLSRENVASQLRLQVRLIEALEDNDEAALPPATFVSGYLRSYARLLDIPEDTIVPPTGSKSEPRLVSTIATKGEASSRDWPARLVTYLVVIAIAVSVAMWWLSQRDGSSEEEVAAQGAEPELVEQGGSMSLALPENAAADEGLPEQEMAEEMLSEATEEEAGNEPEAPVEEAEVKEEPSVAVEQPVKPKPSSGTVPPLQDTTPQSKLEFRYEADSWTEVTDARGRQLSYGLVKAGEVLMLRGEAPFRVFLGYATGVNVYYNGELFDHSPFQRRDVARFRIGRAEHNHPGSR